MISFLIYILILVLIYAIVRLVIKRIEVSGDVIKIVDLVFLVVIVIFTINFLLGLAGQPIIVLR